MTIKVNNHLVMVETLIMMIGNEIYLFIKVLKIKV